MARIQQWLLMGILLWGIPVPVWAHGIVLGHDVLDQVIRVYADYDSGESMAGAQVQVFSPQDIQNPWFVGTVDPLGHFYFLPDAGIPGTWEVMVRQAGHGGIVRIEVDEADNDRADISSSSGLRAGFSPVQRGLLMGTTVWGFVGTALFFAGRKP